MFKQLKKLYWLGFGISLSFLLSGLLLVASPERVKVWAATPPGNTLSHETLSSLGKFKKGGSVDLPPEFAEQLGTNKIQWGVGQRPVDAIPAGVWNSAFKVGKLNTAQINPTQDMNAAGLGNYKFLSKMPIGKLVQGMPNLAQMKISDIKPLYDMVAAEIAKGKTPPTLPPSGEEEAQPATTISELVDNPEWADTPLPEDLSSYAASDIPGLANTPIENFPQAMANPASSFPGLANMPIVNMPGFNVPSGYQVGKFDSIHTKEPVVRKVISGSKEEPNAVCTDKNCNHIEVQSLAGGILNGAQIVDGDTQKVNGGYGFMRAIASKEPAGMQPYGESIQEVYHNFDAQSGNVDRSWYFNICNHGWIDWGCSAHFIGPIPIGTLHEGSGSVLLLGNISIPVKVPAVKIPKVSAATIVKAAVSAIPGNPSTNNETPPSPSTATNPTATSALNVISVATKIAAIIPGAKSEQIQSILKSQSSKIDPATGKAYSQDVILQRSVEELISGSNSPAGNNALSLGLGQSVDTIIKLIK